MKKTIGIAAMLLINLMMVAQVKLPRLFSNHMVLQRDKPIPVWGWASAKEKITVKFNGKTKTVTASKEGKWKVYLDATAAGGPFEMEVAGKQKIILNNILVGDVWVCSGQSNMEWPLKNTLNASIEIAKANYPMIRHFTVPKTTAAQPKEDITDGEWKRCEAATAGDFTAVGYYFAKEIFKQTGIPIGLLHSSWGGTDVETWTSRQAFENSDEFKAMITAMPNVNLEQLAQTKKEALLNRINLLQEVKAQTEATIAQWKNVDFNDTKWPIMQAPLLWENQSLPDFDGVVWMRKSINIKPADAGKKAVIELSMIDDADETYFNGIKIGSTNDYQQKRKYTIPEGIVKAGINVIAIKILDTGGGGGIWGDNADLKITVDETNISLAGDWKYQVDVASSSTVSVGPNSYPTLLYNGMIHPLIHFSIKGVLWYQGENNAGRAFQYRKAFPLLITDWRKQWASGDFPFYFVQLASFNANNGTSQNGSGWAELREAQTNTLSLPNTGMAVTTDIGEPKDIHPRNKEDVGKRLAAIALHKNYNMPVAHTGPIYQSMKIDGDKIILTFTHTGSSLLAKNKYGYLQGFEIAGADKKFIYAKAFIKGNTVIVFQDGLQAPVAVRFGWADDNSENNLFNKEGFPAVPFRTDDWKGVTENNTYFYTK